MDKDRLQMYVDITKKVIVLCWLSLFCFWAIKIFGGNFFNIVVHNDNFIKFSNYIQNENSWIKYIVSFITIFIAKYLTFGAICQKFYFKGKQAVVIILAIVSIWVVSSFMPMGKLKFPAWYAYVVYIFIGAVYRKGKYRLVGVLAILLETIFTLLSAYIRNIPIEIQSNYLIAFVLSIDVYIMCSLYYLYTNLKRIKEVNK